VIAGISPTITVRLKEDSTYDDEWSSNEISELGRVSVPEILAQQFRADDVRPA